MAAPYSAELAFALRAVHSASLLTKSVLRTLQNHVSAETKPDSSPVTVADFAAQAILIAALHAVFPSDAFLGEESADALRENEGLADRVWGLVQQSRTGDVQGVGAGLGALTLPPTKEDMFDLIDCGGKATGTGEGRVWVMDPVDGTATFMQGQQYAVCLCLLVDGVQKVGVIACPNLAFDVYGPLGQTRIHEDRVDETGHGVVLSAVQGQGTYVRAMHADSLGDPRRIDLTQLPTRELSALNFVECTMGKTSLSQAEHKAVAETLGANWPGTVVWSQQLKYVALALGSTDVMVRIPKTKDRFTCVWDHAGGHILFQEAGGVIKDFNGEDINFAQGRHITGDKNYGMIATMPALFDNVDQAIKQVLARRPQ